MLAPKRTSSGKPIRVGSKEREGRDDAELRLIRVEGAVTGARDRAPDRGVAPGDHPPYAPLRPGMDTCVSGCAGDAEARRSSSGKGKGTVEYWAARVKPGRIMFEVDGVSKEIATVALELAAAKLPVQTKVVTRLVGGGD